MFVFSSSQKPTHHPQFSFYPSIEPFPTNPYVRKCWFVLHIVSNLPISFHHLLIKPSSSLIWTKLCLLDLLLPLLHIAARTTSLRHKPDHGISYFEELHGSLSSTVKFRTSYHDLQACRSGSCLPC